MTLIIIVLAVALGILAMAVITGVMAVLMALIMTLADVAIDHIIGFFDR